MFGVYQRETVRNNGLNGGPGLMRQFKSFVVRSRAERRLKQLDDRLLADVGVKRADIGRGRLGLSLRSCATTALPIR